MQSSFIFSSSFSYSIDSCTIIQLYHCTNYIYIYVYSIFVFNFHMTENVSLVYLILVNINLEVYIIDFVYIYYNLVTEMQAAAAIIFRFPGAYFIVMSYFQKSRYSVFRIVLHT